MAAIRIAPNTAELLKEVLQCVKPPPRMTVSQWADAERRLPGESSEAGRWKTDKAPYQRAIMDAVTDPHYKKFVIMSAAQIGKSEIILNIAGYFMQYAPAAIMIIQPTKEMAEDFSKKRLAAMIRDTPSLAGMIDEKSRSSGNTILQKIFPGGSVTLIGANSPNSLRSRPVKILLADEVDSYPESAGKEGDPLMLAQKRQTTFWDAKTVEISTPTIKGVSRIEEEYLKSTMEEWQIPCPNCGKYQPLVWANVRWEQDHPEKVTYICEYCGCTDTEHRWKSGSVRGRYVAEHPERDVRGFHLNTLASTLCSWEMVVQNFLDAKAKLDHGSAEEMIVWTNTELGQTWEDNGIVLDDEALYRRRELYDAEVPDGVAVLTCGVDVQEDRLEVEVVGWGYGRESWGIQYKKIFGDPMQEPVWEELDRFLLGHYSKKNGAMLPILATCIDSGYKTDEVYKFCADKFDRRVFAIKGRSAVGLPFINNPSRNNREKVNLFVIGVDKGKETVYERLKTEQPGPGYSHFPANDWAGYDRTYFKGLTAEKRVTRYRKGRPVFVWELKDRNQKRNEPLDLRDYATAAVEIAQPEIREGGVLAMDAPAPVQTTGRRVRGGIKQW